MIITKKFIFVHFPKTGGSFVRTVLYRLCFPPHGISFSRRPACFFLRVCVGLCHRFRFPGTGERFVIASEVALPAGKKFPLVVCWWAGCTACLRVLNFRWMHGSFHQLPDRFLLHKGIQKPVLLTVRNPFAQYVSMYFFNTARNESSLGNVGATKNSHTFREYLLMANQLKYKDRHEQYFPSLERRHDIGFLSMQLIFFAAPRPREIMEMSADEFIAFFKGGRYRDWFRRLRVLHAEDMNRELYQFLLEMGYSEERIRFIPEQGPVNASPPAGKNWRDFYDDELLRWVYEKEWIYFEMFPEYGLGRNGVAPADS